MWGNTWSTRRSGELGGVECREVPLLQSGMTICQCTNPIGVGARSASRQRATMFSPHSHELG